MKLKDYIKNSFTEVNYNRFESDIYWGIPTVELKHANFVDVLNLQREIKIFNVVRNSTHNTILEVGWTILPMIILLLIALPSMRLLYFMENPLKSILFTYDCSVTVIGHQWYWSYEYLTIDYLDIQDSYLFKDYHNSVDTQTTLLLTSDIFFKSFDSYMLPLEEVMANVGLRLLDVDKPLIVPVNTKLKFFITSVDVIHSWAIPSLGIKTDAVPGRLSLVSTIIKDSGIFFGQCSEICGIGHGFMPIKLICL
jgi:heme/copper-type cytochrome/quinol oxidase subunit 2